MDVSNTMPSATKENIHKLIDVLIATEDNDSQVKMLSVLAIALISSDDFNEDIITCNVIYDKIRGLLTQKLPSKTAITLNFISAMVYIDVEEGPTRKKSLVLYAQNMLRNSGCLLAMCCLFTNPMMHQYTWSALCRCIAESCRLSYENQSFCSHLVAKCVKKCARGDLDAFLTLKSLLHNHTHNTQLFWECDGITIFNSKSLQSDVCMQLLDMLVQSISGEYLQLLHKQVFQHLHYFKAVHGVDTRVGQWATVVLHHFSTRVKELRDTDKNYCNDNSKQLRNFKESSNATSLKPLCDDTARLLQNVMREIYQYNVQGAMKMPLTDISKQNTNCDTVTNFGKQNRSVLKNYVAPQNCKVVNNTLQSKSNVLNEDSLNELSFTFLFKQPLRDSNANKNLQHTQSQIRETALIKQRTQRLSQENLAEKTLNYNAYFNNTHNSTCHTLNKQLNNNTFDFKPTFVSTPKHVQRSRTRPGTRMRSINSTKCSRLSRYSLRNFKKHSRNEEYIKNINYPKENENSRVDSLRHRSMSSRLFDAINDSCTTLVKTVRNIFKPKKSTENTQGEKSVTPSKVARGDDSCSYSFTEYMRKRDTELTNEVTKNTSAMSQFKQNDNCKTCNDTLLLKRKIMSDDCLKETVKKLKLGINIYGCDFKKISRTMWPREPYMTPEVLYNLYRKIIIK